MCDGYDVIYAVLMRIISYLGMWPYNLQGRSKTAKKQLCVASTHPLIRFMNVNYFNRQISNHTVCVASNFIFEIEL